MGLGYQTRAERLTRWSEHPARSRSCSLPRVDRPQPQVSGPITGGRRGWPFGAAAFGLEALGYVEQEWFFSGDAVCYSHVAGTDRGFDGCWQAEPTRSVPFASRMLVRRPSDPAKFNGTVVVFWANVSLGFDIFTGESTRLYEGCAFVGVTSQRTAVEGYRDGPPYGLRSWDPERYGNLSIPTDDASYDIFTQAARLLGCRRPTGALDPLGGLDVRHVMGTAPPSPQAASPRTSTPSSRWSEPSTASCSTSTSATERPWIRAIHPTRV